MGVCSLNLMWALHVLLDSGLLVAVDANESSSLISLNWSSGAILLVAWVKVWWLFSWMRTWMWMCGILCITHISLCSVLTPLMSTHAPLISTHTPPITPNKHYSLIHPLERRILTHLNRHALERVATHGLRRPQHMLWVGRPMRLDGDHADEVSRRLDPVLGAGDLDDAVHHADAPQQRADLLSEIVGHSQHQDFGGVLQSRNDRRRALSSGQDV